jgi:hypothetical protein
VALARCTRVASRLHVIAPFSVNTPRWLSTYYSKDHEWVKVEGSLATVGITNFAAKALGDVVYVGLPDVGDKFASGCVRLHLVGVFRITHTAPVFMLFLS